jgi:hypothetical protein
MRHATSGKTVSSAEVTPAEAMPAAMPKRERRRRREDSGERNRQENFPHHHFLSGRAMFRGRGISVLQ